MGEILEINDLSVIYFKGRKKVVALDGLSIRIKEGERLGIVGESGSGKSTLAFSILNLIMPYEGKIINGEILFQKDNKWIDILELKEEEIRKIRGKEISIVFQDPFTSLNPVLRIREQILETLKFHDLPQDENNIIELLKELQIGEPKRILDSYPHQLSGGQRQRICILNAIQTYPKVLIADEPTSALDTITQNEILELLKKIQAKFNLTLILITHNPWLMKKQTERLGVMYAGMIVEIGDTDDIFSEPLHPYTRSLIESIPSLEKRGKRLYSLPLGDQEIFHIKGCRFWPRCSRRKKICKEELPELLFQGGRGVRCFFA